MFYHGRMRVEYREEPCKVALNRVKGMPFEWSLNPYMGCVHRCTFCYVRAFERRADRPSDDRYGTSIRVKVNVAEVLRVELSRPSWQGDGITIGAATDPYQPAEGRYRLTRACLQALHDHRTPVGITTRGPMIVRDVDILSALARRAHVMVCISVPSLDAGVVARTEPGTAPPRQRLRALRVLRDAGIRAGVLRAPILPGISDSATAMGEVVRAAHDSGAAFIGAGALRLAPGTREHFMDRLAADFPDLVEEYRRLFAGRTGLPSSYTTPLMHTVRALRLLHRVDDRPEHYLTPEPVAAQLTLSLAS